MSGPLGLSFVAAPTAAGKMVAAFALLLILATSVAAVEAGQCDAGALDDPACQEATATGPAVAGTAAAAAAGGGSATTGVTAQEPSSQAASPSEGGGGAGGGDGASLLGDFSEESPRSLFAGEVGSAQATAPEGKRGRGDKQAMKREIEGEFPSASRAGLVLSMLSAVCLWIGAILKFTCDGSLPARLALWGLLPEVCAAVSVSALSALLRLKTTPTPAIVLRNCVTDKNAGQLAEAMRAYAKTSQLQVVELPCNPGLGEEGLRAIVEATMADDSQVAELDFSFNPQLGDKAIAVLRPTIVSKASKVQVLRLAGCGLSHGGLEKLAEAAAKSKLRTVDISRNELGGAPESLVALLEAPMLEEVALACCGLKVTDVRAVAEQLPYTSIRSLQLSGNGFGSPGVAALAEHLPTSQIDELSLEYNEIDREALSTLGTAWAKRPFSRMSLKGNRLTQDQIHGFIKTLKSMHG